MKINIKLLFVGVFLVMLLVVVSATYQEKMAVAAAGPAGAVTPRINVPYTTAVPPDIPVRERAITWFGQVNTFSNYVDIRTIYNQDTLLVVLHIMDKKIWYDATLPVENLTAWDAATLYVSTEGNVGSTPTANDHQFVGQVKQNPPFTGYYAAYQGNGVGWVPAPTLFGSETAWRGHINNNNDARGWVATFRIPFTSLGLAGPPAAGTVWGMGVAVHDRDDAAGTSIADQVWPDMMNGQQPGTWGQIHFGQPTYVPENSTPAGSVTIHESVDAHVGGHSTCGSPFDPNFFEGWGDANYAGYTQINIQNQWDVADWPCFSKYYITFPLDAVPPGKEIVSATMTMYMFGNAGQGWNPGPEASYIQIHRIVEDWNENSITWNNGPQTTENMGGTWVDPINYNPPWPGLPITWDASRAVHTAYENGEPLRLALYSADSERHSGKYFASADSDAAARPFLEVVWANSLVQVLPPVQRIEPGGVAVYTIDVPVLGASPAAVTLTADEGTGDLIIDLEPAVVTSPGQATLTVTDTHSGPLPAGLWYTIPVTASDGNVTQTVDAYLLVGGGQQYLPFIVRH